MNQANKDLITYLESIPYGTVTVQVVRRDRKTNLIRTTGEETLKYEDNQVEEAKTDISEMINNLVKGGYTGEAHIKLSMKDGKIKLLSIFNKKETRY